MLDFVPVGVRYDLDPDPARRRTDLENMRRLRFTVVVPGEVPVAVREEDGVGIDLAALAALVVELDLCEVAASREEGGE